MVYIGALKGSMDSAIPELTTQLRDKSEYALSNPQEIRHVDLIACLILCLGREFSHFKHEFNIYWSISQT